MAIGKNSVVALCVIIISVFSTSFLQVNFLPYSYKMLLVILGRVDIYITSKTYKWDTCAGEKMNLVIEQKKSNYIHNL